MRLFSGHVMILARSRRARLSLARKCRRRCVGDAYGSGIAPAILHLVVAIAENYCRSLTEYISAYCSFCFLWAHLRLTSDMHCQPILQYPSVANWVMSGSPKDDNDLVEYTVQQTVTSRSLPSGLSDELPRDIILEMLIIRRSLLPGLQVENPHSTGIQTLDKYTASCM